MLTLASTFLSFLSGGLPTILDIFKDRGDKKHELEMMRLQSEREAVLAEKGFKAQQNIEEIKAETAQIQATSAERIAMYKHDAGLADGASTWVVNLRASVRPVVTYIFVLLLVVVDIAGIWYAYKTGVPFAAAMENAFSDDEMLILSSIVAFWFGTQAFSRSKQ